MKGLKTLGAMLLSVALLAAATTATAGAAAYKHYVACGVSQNATPAHSLPEASQKGRFLQKPPGRCQLQRLRQVPDRQKHLRESSAGHAGHPLRQQDDLEHSRQAPGHLVRRRQDGRLLRLQGHWLSWAPRARRSSASTRRLPTPPSARCAAARCCTRRRSASRPTEARGTRPPCSLRWSARRR